MNICLITTHFRYFYLIKQGDRRRIPTFPTLVREFFYIFNYLKDTKNEFILRAS